MLLAVAGSGYQEGELLLIKRFDTICSSVLKVLKVYLKLTCPLLA